ncbi:MAG: antibiotic biosynthesis monooxygenase [Ardenticatenaceae bacterium]|nr:antibiotic biosynthesis monooxygenase [Ardenticatenaceae bacterium]
MSQQVAWVLQMSIKEGQYDNVIALMEEMVAATQANEPGALSYEWSVNDDKTVCHLYERYADSAATMVHMGNFGGKFMKRFFTYMRATGIFVYGSPNDEVKGALAGLKPLYMGSIGGFTRHG